MRKSDELREAARAKADEVFATINGADKQTADIQRLWRDTFMLGWLHGREYGQAETLAVFEKALP